MKPTILLLAVLVISIVVVSVISDSDSDDDNQFEERNINLPELLENTMYKRPNHSFSSSMVQQFSSVIIDN